MVSKVAFYGFLYNSVKCGQVTIERLIFVTVHSLSKRQTVHSVYIITII